MKRKTGYVVWRTSRNWIRHAATCEPVIRGCSCPDWLTCEKSGTETRFDLQNLRGTDSSSDALLSHTRSTSAESEDPLSADSSIRHWHRNLRLPRFHRACPSTALDERVLIVFCTNRNSGQPVGTLRKTARSACCPDRMLNVMTMSGTLREPRRHHRQLRRLYE